MIESDFDNDSADGSSDVLGGGKRSSSYDETSTTSDSRGGGGSQSEDSYEKKSNTWMERSRCCVLLFLLIAAGVVGYCGYRLASNEERQAFEHDYESVGEEVLEESEIRARNVFGSIQTMSIVASTMASSAKAKSSSMAASSSANSTTTTESANKSSWPFVTLPKFEAWAGGLSLALTGAESLSFGVIVDLQSSSNERDEWEEYSKVNANLWVQESIDYYKQVVIPDSSSSEDGKKGEQDESGSYDDLQHIRRKLRLLQEEESSSDDESDDDANVPLLFDIIEATSEPVTHFIWSYDENEDENNEDGSKTKKKKQTSSDNNNNYGMDVAAVNWQMTPVNTNSINHNEFELYAFKKAFIGMTNDKQAILTEMVGEDHFSFLIQPIFRNIPKQTQQQQQNAEQDDDDDDNDNEELEIVGYFKAALPWNTYFKNLLPENKAGIHVVVENTCNQAVTYELDGVNAYYLGDGDLHDTKYDSLVFEEEFDPLEIFKGKTSGCEYGIHLYPTDKFVQNYATNKPALYASIGVLAILFASCIFLFYDWSVRKRQHDLAENMKRSNAIVNSLFPANVRDRLLGSTSGGGTGSGSGTNNLTPGYKTPFGVIKKDNNDTNSSSRDDRLQIRGTKPIADLFPSATVLFADIAGFTAWSSVREPSQVFVLLESIYDSFDTIAKKVGVFKVETIGDCYVATCGLPTPRVDHAVVMANFSRKCMAKMKRNVVELEVLLGPGTADLGMRFGLHSGPVMAGVLRGEKSRFQLFGDTVNTCSRIEATGAKNNIHLSEQTANLLIEAGKGKWVKPRSSLVTAKGKGALKTYWLDVNANDTNNNTTTQIRSAATTTQKKKNMSSTPSSSFVPTVSEWCGTDGDEKIVFDVRMERLIDFNTEILGRLLKKMVAMRYSSSSSSNNNINKRNSSRKAAPIVSSIDTVTSSGGFVIDEVKEIIQLPQEAAKYDIDPDNVDLGPHVTKQLRDYVSTIAGMYNDNMFHSFDHASHVSMSATKLLSRVVTPDTIDYAKMTYKAKATSTKLHDFTFGITSDPITQFAVAFSCLIHDVDHPGVPNAQLVKEGADVAEQYRNQSVAEQNSVDLSWDLLMEPVYADLRKCIYTTQDERDRFRQLVVNAVMATDIADKELGALRKRRWEKAFDPDLIDESPEVTSNRKATIVIEHLIQASDVAHTMQHWHVYIKWNKRFFNECYSAYLSGRAEKDPSEGWYKGEIGFFDFYIIPLAKKLKDCGVFGVSSDEYLDYAIANRNEWEQKGKDLVAEYVAEFDKGSDHDSAPDSTKSLDNSGKAATVDTDTSSNMDTEIEV